MINFPSTLVTQTMFIEGDTSELGVLLKIDPASQLFFRWAAHKWNAYVNVSILNSGDMAGKTVHFALVYDATNYNASSSSTAVDVGNTTSQTNADLKFYYKVPADNVGWILPPYREFGRQLDCE